MSRQSVVSTFGAGAVTAAVLVLGLVLVLWPSSAEAGWGVPYLGPPRVVRVTGPDLSWLMDVPEKPGARSRGKVAVFAFANDDVYQPLRAAVVRNLRRRGLTVTATLRPLDSALQYREMSQALNLAVFVEGEVTGDGVRQSAVVRLRSGVSGQRIASARFSGPTDKIVEAINHKLWTRVGPAITRACTGVAKSRRLEREPLRIDAGTPLDGPISANGT